MSPTNRVLPRHLYEQRSQSAPVKVPEGYRRVWEDDRLNPRRAEQTLQGRQQMHQRWSRTTPLRDRD